MTALWTSADAAAATGGRVTRAWNATGVSIDTRELKVGDLFVALRDVRDGHDFVRAALDKGAAAALVSRIPEGVEPDAPLLIVPDVLPALEALGRAARARTQARVVGVTGSVGKTSTKEMLRAILAGQGRVHAAEKSFNNHWGVPLTLARMPADTQYAVIEIGMNHPGEIAPLARLARLHVAMVTTVAPAHLAAFEDVPAIAREKAAIFQGLEPGGIAVINGDLEVTPILAAGAAAADAQIVRFGTGADCDWRLIEVTLSHDTTIARATAGGAPFLYKITSPGRHFALNALGALAVAEALGADRVVSACDLGLWTPPAGRGAREEIVLDLVDDHLRISLFDDAYNANPASMAAALDVLAGSEPQDGVGRQKTGRRIAILGDMLELGPQEMHLHADLARHPAIARIHRIHCIGPRMRALWDALPEAKRGEWHETSAGLTGRVHALVDAGDVVLVKGSLGSRLGGVVDALRKLGQSVAQETRGTD